MAGSLMTEGCQFAFEIRNNDAAPWSLAYLGRIGYEGESSISSDPA